MSSPDNRPSILDEVYSACGAPQSLTHELRSADLHLRKGLHVPRAGRTGYRSFDLIWLVYSGFFFILPIHQNRLSTWLWFGLFYAAFLAIYIGMVLASSPRRQKALLVAMAVLGFVYCPFNPGACGIFIYVTAFVPFATESIFTCVGTMVLVCLGMVAEAHWTVPEIGIWSLVLCGFFAIAVGAGNMTVAQRMRANKRLALAHEQIAHLSRVAERERIARDLHDVLGHTLSVVVLKSELAGKVVERDPDRARREIGEVEQIARQALTEVREAISGYRAEGLSAEIDRARMALDAAGVVLECESRPPRLAPAEETVLSLIVREAVTNIVRHSQASRCRLAIEASGVGTELLVEDDGRGGIREEGNGLRGMRERAESLGGRLRVESAAGTRLIVELPARGALPVSDPVLS